MAGNLTAMIAAAFSGSAAPPVTSDPYFEYTTLLLPGNGTNGAQNNTFLDSSTNNFTITRNGNTTQGTFSPFSQTGWGNYFNGSSYLTVPYNAAFDPGSGNFTVETWVYFNSISTVSGQDQTFLGNVNGNTGDGDWGLGYRASPTRFEFTGSSNGLLSGVQRSYFTITPVVGTWYHVVGVKNGSTLSCYVNGVKGTDATLATVSNSNLTLNVAQGAGNTVRVNGYLSNSRIVKGVAVYSGSSTSTANFTVTSPLTATQSASTNIAAITGTQTSLLTCQSNRFVDNSVANSGTGFTITVNGSPSVQAFSPFNPSASWSAATYGGSGYFDGTGDYLSVTDNASFTMGSGDFTIEFWAYTTTTNNQTAIIQIDSAGSTSALSFGVQINTSKWRAILASGSTFYSATATANAIANQWNHIAFVRNGNTGTLYINGNADGTVSLTGVTINDSSQNITIGGEPTSNYLSGYISNARVVKGTAVYTSNFTPPTAPLTAITNTSLLLNYTNGGIYDATSKNDLETVGNAQISTAQSKWGGSSMAFDGTGDYLVLGNPSTNPNLNFGSADFTIESWVYPLGTSTYLVAGSLNDNNGNGCWWLFVNGTFSGGSTIQFGYNTTSTGTGTNILAGSGTLSTNTWTHIAVTRSGANIRCFVNGTQVGTTNTGIGTSAIFPVNQNILIGHSVAGNSYAMNGYLQDLRITRGYARYTANFTPPTAAFPTL